MKRKLYRQAVARGLCFEIQYADLLNRKTRVATIHYSHLLHMYYKCMVGAYDEVHTTCVHILNS